MCGIAGLWRSGPSSPDELTSLAGAMAGALAHRGPDASGAWADAEAGLGLGHTRLAVLDLSPAGHQPMQSAGGRHVLVYNGEIYNHLDIRAELEAAGRNPPWRGHSDTETLLAAIEAWGLAAALRRAVGMFALALWDRQTRRLSLARDRAGEKPLYYGRVAGAFAFASELKALRRVPGFDNPVDRDALRLYTRFTVVPAPRSIYREICKLPPGFRLTLSSDDIAAGRVPPPVPYWSAAEVARDGFRLVA